MSRTKCVAIAAPVAAVTLGAATVGAQQPPPQSPGMTFFITSAGLGKGADLGGLDGADKQCQALAQAAGAGSKTWRAYLSTQVWMARPPSTLVTASEPAPGRISKAKLSQKASMICIATAINWEWRHH